jgi:hypothetical protein
MIKIPTSDLQGAALDWVVDKCKRRVGLSSNLLNKGCRPRRFSTLWAEGGPIIEQEGLCISYDPFVKRWNCYTQALDSYHAETALVAAMRCYVASKLGDEVEIPEELK